MTETHQSHSQTLLAAAGDETATITPPRGYNCSSMSLYPFRAGSQSNPSYHCTPSEGECAAYVHTLEFPRHPGIFPSPMHNADPTNDMQVALYPGTPISTLTCVQDVPDSAYLLETNVPFSFGLTPSYPAAAAASSPAIILPSKAMCEAVIASVPVSISDLDRSPSTSDVQTLLDTVNMYSPLAPQVATSPTSASTGYPKWISIDGIPQTSGIALVLKETGTQVAQFHQSDASVYPCGFPRYTTQPNTEHSRLCAQCVDDDNVCSDYVYAPTHDPSSDGPATTATVPTCKAGSYSAVSSVPCSEMDDTEGTGSPLSEVLDQSIFSVWNCTPYVDSGGSFSYTCSGQLTSESSGLTASDFEVRAYRPVDCSTPAFSSCVMGLVNVLQRDLENANQTTQKRVVEQLRYNLPTDASTSGSSAVGAFQNSYVNWMLAPGCYVFNKDETALIQTADSECAPSCSPTGKYACNGAMYDSISDAYDSESCSSSGDVPCIPYACPNATVTLCDKDKGTLWVTSPAVDSKLAGALNFDGPADWTLSSEHTLSARGSNQFSNFANAPLDTTGAGTLQSVSQLLTHGIIANTCHASQLEASKVDRYSTVVSDPADVSAITQRIFALTNTGCVHTQSGVMTDHPWNIGTAQMVADVHQINNSAFGLQMGYSPSVGCSALPNASNPNIGGSAWADVLGQLCVDRVISCETGCKYPLYAFDGDEPVPADAMSEGCGCPAPALECALCMSGRKKQTTPGSYVCEKGTATTSHALPQPSLTKQLHEWRVATNVDAQSHLPIGVKQSAVNNVLPHVPWTCSKDKADGGMSCTHATHATRDCTVGSYSQKGSAQPGCYVGDIRFDLATVPLSCSVLPDSGQCASCGDRGEPVQSQGVLTDEQMKDMCSSQGVCLYNNKVVPYMYSCHEPVGFDFDAFTTSVANMGISDDHAGSLGEVCKVCSLVPGEDAGNSQPEALCRSLGGIWYDGASHKIGYLTGGTYDASASCTNQITDWKCDIVDREQIECTTGSLTTSSVDIDLESDVTNAPVTTAPLAPATSGKFLEPSVYTHTSKYMNQWNSDPYGLDRYHAQLAKHATGNNDPCISSSAQHGSTFITSCDATRGEQLSLALGFMYG